jgi:hypothetical protein
MDDEDAVCNHLTFDSAATAGIETVDTGSFQPGLDSLLPSAGKYKLRDNLV